MTTYNLTQVLEDASKGKEIHPSTKYNWVSACVNKYPYVRYGKTGQGKILYTGDAATFKLASEWLTEKVDAYNPHKKSAVVPNTPVVSAKTAVDDIQTLINNLRGLGYTVECTITAPAIEL